MGTLVFLVLALAVFWLLLVRPQRRRHAVQTALLEGLRVGDEVVTAGGIIGEITALENEEVLVEIAPGTVVRVARRAIAAVVPDEDAEDDADDEEVVMELPTPKGVPPSEGEGEDASEPEAPTSKSRRGS